MKKNMMILDLHKKKTVTPMNFWPIQGQRLLGSRVPQLPSWLINETPHFVLQEAFPSASAPLQKRMRRTQEL